MTKYETILNEPIPEGNSCGHVGAIPHTYTSVGVTETTATCPACHEQLSNQLAVIETVKDEFRYHAHAVAARAGQLDLKPNTILRVLRALAKISNHTEEPFVLAWAHWCWDNFQPSTGSALAFPTENIPHTVSEPGLGGRRYRSQAQVH